MAYVNGQLTICDRCGEQTFRKVTGEGEADGGFTRWNEFESYPPGWGLVEIPYRQENSSRRAYNVMVCSKCNKLWGDVLKEGFLKGTKLDF